MVKSGTGFCSAKQAKDRAPSGCGLQPRWLCCSSLTHRALGTHRRSRLASGLGGLQQNANLFLREAWLSRVRKRKIEIGGANRYKGFQRRGF